MNNLELKPCPFCGSSGSGDIIVHDYGANAMEPDAFVQCHQCTTTGPFGATAEEAIAAWNRRTESRLAQQGNAGDQEAEHFIQEAIDHAPEPLRRLGEYLGKVLDEDQWKTAERMLLGIAATQANGQGKEAEPADRYCFCLNHACGWSGFRDTAIAHESRGIICPYCKGATQECTPKDQKERALFEAHMRKDGWGGWSLSRSEVNGLYADGVVNRFWEVWKARSALSLPVPIAAIQEKP